MIKYSGHKLREYNGKKYLIVYEDILTDVIDRVGRLIVIDKFEDFKVLIDSDEGLPGELDLKKVLFLNTCIIKDGKSF